MRGARPRLLVRAVGAVEQTRKDAAGHHQGHFARSPHVGHFGLWLGVVDLAGWVWFGGRSREVWCELGEEDVSEERSRGIPRRFVLVFVGEWL